MKCSKTINEFRIRLVIVLFWWPWTNPSIFLFQTNDYNYKITTKINKNETIAKKLSTMRASVVFLW